VAHPLEPFHMPWQDDGGVEHARAVVPIDERSAYLSALFQLGKRDPKDINILEMRKTGRGWTPWGGIAFPAVLMFQIIDAIGAMSANKPFPAHPKKSLAALTIADDGTDEIAKHVIEMNTKRVVAVFHAREGESRRIRICEFKRAKGGWSIDGEMQMPEERAFELAKAITAFRSKI
jgi:hypothetical protein